MMLPHGKVIINFQQPDGWERRFVIFVETDRKKRRVKVWSDSRQERKHFLSVLTGEEAPAEALPIAELKVGEIFVFEGRPVFKVTEFRLLSGDDIKSFPPGIQLLTMVKPLGVEIELLDSTFSVN